MFASALTYKSCECQLAAADQEALPTKNKPLSFQVPTSEVWGLKGTKKTKGDACYIYMASIPDTCDLFVVRQHCQRLFSFFFFYHFTSTAFRPHLSSFKCSRKVKALSLRGNIWSKVSQMRVQACQEMISNFLFCLPFFFDHTKEVALMLQR